MAARHAEQRLSRLFRPGLRRKANDEIVAVTPNPTLYSKLFGVAQSPSGLMHPGLRPPDKEWTTAKDIPNPGGH
jgi:hypothetical protein